MAQLGVMDIKQLEEIIDILKKNGVTEFELTEDGTHIRLTRAALTSTAQPVTTLTEVEPAIVGTAQPESASASPDEAAVPEHLKKVDSPIVGTFYRKPSPDSEPYVNVGASVSKGDTLCIIEAMKLMNEIEAPCDGKVEKILLQDGQVVEFGETLFLIDPKG